LWKEPHFGFFIISKKEREREREREREKASSSPHRRVLTYHRGFKSYSLHPIPYDFLHLHFEKHFSKTEYTVCRYECIPSGAGPYPYRSIGIIFLATCSCRLPYISRRSRYISVTLIQVRPPGYFIHISITTPIVPALKTIKPLLDLGGGFTSETAARRFQK
jgi:hypothetical protein